MSQVIVCAAVRIAGKVLPSVRHWDAFTRDLARSTGATGKEEQGFLDNRGQFLTRQEAWVVAEAAGQIKYDHNKCPGTLYTEHMY